MNDVSPYIKGNLTLHVIRATIAGSLGLLAMFAVDFIDIYFIGLLGEPALAAAIGYAASITFFSTSLAIGASIAMSVLLASRVGKGDFERAKLIQANSMAITLLMVLPITLTIVVFAESLLVMLGAQGETLELAILYLRTVILGYPFLSIGITLSGALRAQGLNAKAAMLVFAAAITNVILDPILIFGLNLGLRGAALATMCAQIAMAITGLYYVRKSSVYFVSPSLSGMREMTKEYFHIAGPAILANLATPVGNAYVTRVISDFGDDAIAGFAVIGRLTPIAFAFVYALSGAVGPIIAQNLGAGLCDRVKKTITASLAVSAGYTAIVTLILMLLEPYIIRIFPLGETGKELMDWFCGPISLMWMFNAWIFIANASFNNLNRPIYSTITNWARQTIFTIPFAVYFSAQMGAVGILVGPAIGGMIISLISVRVAMKISSNKDITTQDPTHAYAAAQNDVHGHRFGHQLEPTAKKVH